MTNTVDTNSYQTYLKNCDCPNGGIIIYQGKAVCRWCRKPYSEGSKMNYLPEHFQQSIPNKQDERIGVNLSRGFNTKSQFQWVCHFYCTKEIKDKDFPEIKNLLERYLNGEMDNPAPTESRLNSKEPLSKVYNSMLFKTDDGEELALCMRDSGYEFKYFGHWYEAKEGIVKPRGQQKTYTQSEVDTIREETWQSARLRKYDTLQDYLNSLSEKKDHYFFNGVKIPFGNPSENKPSTTPIEDKGWEILTWFSREGEVALLVCGEIEGNLYAGYKIRSVRRTSDNEVFTVGDNIEFGSAGLKPDTPIELDNAAIISWNIREDGMIYAEILKDIFFPINHLRKSKPQDKGNVLFTTEDGVAVMAGEYVWVLSTNNWCSSKTKVPENGNPFKGVTGKEFKYFSSYPSVEQYIIENKPCLSLSDLQKEWFMKDEQVQFGKWEGIPMYRRFQQIAKKKLNQ